MAKFHIDYCLVSAIEAVEYNHQLERHYSAHQLIINENLLRAIKPYPQLKALIWVKPHHETIDYHFNKFFEENIDQIYGIKFHPYHSKLAFNDPLMFPYFELAKKYQLPIVTHTSSDEYSKPELVYEMALKYPDINFVMYHLELGSDNLEAIKYLNMAPNLYGDTAWVMSDKATLALEVAPHKLMFGTDALIDGIDHYLHDYYLDYLTTFKEKFSSEVYDSFIYKTAYQIFNFKQKNKAT